MNVENAGKKASPHIGASNTSPRLYYLYPQQLLHSPANACPSEFPLSPQLSPHHRYTLSTCGTRAHTDMRDTLWESHPNHPTFISRNLPAHVTRPPGSLPITPLRLGNIRRWRASHPAWCLGPFLLHDVPSTPAFSSFAECSRASARACTAFPKRLRSLP